MEGVTVETKPRREDIRPLLVAGCRPFLHSFRAHRLFLPYHHPLAYIPVRFGDIPQCAEGILVRR